MEVSSGYYSGFIVLVMTVAAVMVTAIVVFMCAKCKRNHRDRYKSASEEGNFPERSDNGSPELNGEYTLQSDPETTKTGCGTCYRYCCAKDRQTEGSRLLPNRGNEKEMVDYSNSYSQSDDPDDHEPKTKHDSNEPKIKRIFCCCYTRTEDNSPQQESDPVVEQTDGHNQTTVEADVNQPTNMQPTKTEQLVVQIAKKFFRERQSASDVKQFWKHYEWVDVLTDIGGRKSKLCVHLKLSTGEGASAQYEDLLLTVMPVTQLCPLKLKDPYTIRKLNELMGQLKNHPNILPVLEVAYLPGENEDDRDHVAVIQPYYFRYGSLKDILYKCAPSVEWDKKYRYRPPPLPREKIALYGRQILEALLYLYKLPKKQEESKESEKLEEVVTEEVKEKKDFADIVKQTAEVVTKKVKHALTPAAEVEGFPPLGHIQSGNVFVEGEVCKLGGYELTTLGYKTRLQKLCKNELEKIDVKMFGHLVFEMAAGYELTETKPTAKDYANVKDEGTRHVLNYIFVEKESYPTIAEVRRHPYFEGEVPPVDPTQVCVTNGMLRLLEQH